MPINVTSHTTNIITVSGGSGVGVEAKTEGFGEVDGVHVRLFGNGKEFFIPQVDIQDVIDALSALP